MKSDFVAGSGTAAGAGRAGLTVAIPNWNHELLLARSVGSALRAVRLLRSRGVGADVLVVDDASRDGSTVLLRQMELPGVNVGLLAVQLTAALDGPLLLYISAHTLAADAERELGAAWQTLVERVCA